MINRTFRIAEASFSELVGHFDPDLGTTRFAVINGEGAFPVIEFYATYDEARKQFTELTHLTTGE